MNYKQKMKRELMGIMNESIADKDLILSLYKFLDNIIIDTQVDTLYKYNLSYKIFIDYLKVIKYDELGWETICNATDEILNKHAFLVNDAFDKNKTSHRKLITYTRVLLEKYFIYLLNFEYKNTLKLDRLKEFQNLFINGTTNALTKKVYNDTINNCICAKYPLNSREQSIFQYQYTYSVKGDLRQAYKNINLNTENELLLEVLKVFIIHEGLYSSGKVIDISFLSFYYYFEESFQGVQVPQKISDFNTIHFESQYEYFLRKDLENENTSACLPFRRILLRFYIFLQQYIDEMDINHDIFKYSWLNCDILKKGKFSMFYEAGYQVFVHNPLEDYPKYDLWFLWPPKAGYGSVNYSKSNGVFLDFTGFDDDFKKDIKDYIWNYESDFKHKGNSYRSIKNFYEFKEEYYEATEGLLYINKPENNSISFDLIWNYRLKLEILYPNANTRRRELSAVKYFLKYHNEKYKIHKKTMGLLSIDEEEKNGSPIINEDFNVLEQAFREISENSRYKNGKLHYYVFILTCTTDLRVGEVLSLERNCIIYKDKNGNGTLRFLRKTSSGQYVEKEYNANVIRLIELAIEHTEEYVNYANDDLKRFIFISQFRDKVSLIANRFSKVFSKVVNDNAEKLTQKYKAYDLRHTFINIIYDEVSNGNLTIDKAQQITGNNYETVMKNYRKKLELKDYAEVICGVTIANVDINGRIVKDENDASLGESTVMKELGKCNQDDCVGPTLCLACNHFVTTLEKIPRFEQEITKHKEALYKAKDPFEKQEIELELKLLGAYLLKMLELKRKYK